MLLSRIACMRCGHLTSTQPYGEGLWLFDMLPALKGGDSGDGVPIPATLVCCPEGNMRLGFRSCNPHVGGFTPIASATAYPPRTHAFTGVSPLRMPYGEDRQ